MAGELKGKYVGLILDMDGVLYRGNQALDGARELFPALREAGISFILLTNNATLTSEDFSGKLARMAISVPPQAILTSAGATAHYLSDTYPEGGEVYVVGEAGLVSYMSGLARFRVGDDKPKFVVVGLDRSFTYDALRKACLAIMAGARFIATNMDATLPMEGGEQWPGAGSIVAAVQTCSGVKPLAIGKPEPFMARQALEQLGLPAEKVLCVGDRLETDILFGKKAGIATALLLTGVSSQVDVERTGIQPDYIYKDLFALMSALGIGQG